MILAPFDVFQHFVALLQILERFGDIDISGAANNNGLYILISHNSSNTTPAGAGSALFNGSKIDPVLTRQADRHHLGFGLIQLLEEDSCGFI